jgi:methanogenic corrinoid protein MtbC1
MEPLDPRAGLGHDEQRSVPPAPPAPADDGRALRALEDIADTPTPDLPVGDRPDRATLIAELVERFSLADRRGAIARIRELLNDGLDDAELRDLVAAAVRHVGDLWQAGHWTITQEHAATAVAEAVLTSLESSASHAEPVGAVAVVAADGEWHALPARLASHAFELAGLTVRYLGAGVPADDIARSLPFAEADVLAISVTVAANLPGAARTVAAGRDAGLPVLLGGAASTPERAAAIGAHAHCWSVDEGAELARSWCAEGPPSAPGPTIDLAAATTLRHAHYAVRDAAFTGTAARWDHLEEAPEHVIDRVTEDLDLHIDHLAAALMLDEPAAYLDLVPWLRSVQVGRKLPAAMIDAQLGGLHDALADLPDARALVERAMAMPATVPLAGPPPQDARAGHG